MVLFEVGGLAWFCAERGVFEIIVYWPVQTHLGIESNLISPTDETEPLTTLVVRRPAGWTCVRFVGPCSIMQVCEEEKLHFGTCPVRIAKLPLRHIFATVSLAPLANGSLKTNIGWTWFQQKSTIAYQVAVRAHIVFMDPEYRTTSLGALTSVCQPARPIKRI